MKNALHVAAREIPVLGEYDVIVCGGGPAGCAAAIAALHRKLNWRDAAAGAQPPLY